MPNDAKCGLLVGVLLVLAVAVLFFQKESPEGGTPLVESKLPTESIPAIPPSATAIPASPPPLTRPGTSIESNVLVPSQNQASTSIQIEERNPNPSIQK